MEPVDLALCLAVDVSASVDYDEFGLMIGGLAEAFRQPDIIAACAAGPRGAIAVSLLLWSGPGARDVAVGWTRIDGPAAAAALAEAIDFAPRLPAPGATALGEGMAAGLVLLATAPGTPPRLTLDVSGDGRWNAGRDPRPVRDAGVLAGVTLNALAVLNEEPDLLEHYRDVVIGGSGAFAISCADYADFARAIREKLLREIGEPLIA
ncbi:DUF1194 domain-containing protein [Humitalea rosea]|nr:DUF1194 domain-containing protein [Humitalea rosea]